MRTFTVGDLQELLAARKGPCVSIFLPTGRGRGAAEGDRLRFKSLVEDATRKLSSTMLPRAVPKIAAQFEPFLAGPFWREQSDGLAVFVAPDFARHFRVQAEMPERVVVADHFHVRPLIRYLQSDRRWYVLVLSKNRAAFFEGGTTGLVERAVPGMPASLEEAVGKLDEQAVLSGHSVRGGAMVFGGSPGPRSEREDVARWFRAIDQSVRRLLADEHAPLVLAGVSRLVAVYRSVARYPHLAAQAVDGNYQRASNGDLFARAAPIAVATLRAREDEAVEEHQRVNGALRSSDDVEIVATAAAHGRVRRLMIARGRTVRGVFDRATGEVKRRAARDDGAGDELLDELAGAVLARGGDVLVVEKDRMPTKSPVAAVLRW
jgi:hypothetical protein